jgi:prepilin-type N-terminal cleavage/methylation domain-containing protein
VGLPSTTLRGTLRNPQSGAGFTLIEVVVTMAIFSMTVLMAITLLVTYIQQQRRTIIQEQLQNDARAVMEKIAQDVREGTIDYTFYNGLTSPYLVQKKLFFSSVDGEVIPLVLLDAFNTQVMYKVSNDILQRCTPATQDTCQPAEWQDISQSAMQVTNFTFFISPSEDAFALEDPVTCGTSGSTSIPTSAVPDDTDCRWGTVCEGVDENGISNGKCALQRSVSTVLNCYCTPQRFGNITPLQPRVTFSITASRTAGGKTVSETFQTAISSRVFQKVDQLNRYVP